MHLFVKRVRFTARFKIQWILQGIDNHRGIGILIQWLPLIVFTFGANGFFPTHTVGDSRFAVRQDVEQDLFFVDKLVSNQTEAVRGV